MNFPDEQTKSAWTALTQAKHAQLAKARAIAVEAAWRDLPTNERDAYMECAYRALRQHEREMAS